MLLLFCLFTLAEAVKFEVNYEAESQSPDSPLSVDGDELIGMTAEEMAELQALQAQAQADAEVDSAEIPVPLPITRQNAYIGSPPASPRDTVTELPLDAQTVTDLPVELAATVTDLPFAATLTDLPVMQPRRTRRKPGKNNAMALASQAPEVPFDDLPLCHCKPPDMNDASQVATEMLQKYPPCSATTPDLEGASAPTNAPYCTFSPSSFEKAPCETFMGGAKATQCQFDRGLRWMTYDTIICVDTDDPDTVAPKTELHRHPVDLVTEAACSTISGLPADQKVGCWPRRHKCDYYACMPFPMNSGLCYGDTVDQHFERVAVEIEANMENPPQLLQKFRSMYPE